MQNDLIFSTSLDQEQESNVNRSEQILGEKKIKVKAKKIPLTLSLDEPSSQQDSNKSIEPNNYLEEEQFKQPKKKAIKITKVKKAQNEKSAPKYVLVEGPEPSQDLSYRWVQKFPEVKQIE